MKALVTYEFYLDTYNPVCDAIGGNEIVRWLEDEIQYSSASIDRQLKKLAEAESGEREDYSGFGNGNWIAANREHVYLESIAGGFACVLLTHAQACDALEKYRAFIDHGREDPDDPPPPFEVEYMIAGEDARRYALKVGLAWDPID